MNVTTRLSRRKWLVGAGLSAGCWAAAPLLAQPSRSANEEMRFACIGVGGKGGANCAAVSQLGRIVALCDIDENTLGKAREKYPQAKTDFDFRRTLEDQAGNLDAVIVSTPDHVHTAIALMAMRLAKHVLGEKPLTRYLQEARLMADVAREKSVVTQMCNQGTAKVAVRRAIECIRSGIVGTIREFHVWSNRPVWPAGPDVYPKVTGAAPSNIHWNECVGSAAMTEYSPDYHPFKWRGWWHFGNGALGDMAAHMINAAFHACDLRNPASVEADHTGHNGISFPKSSTVRWEFAATQKRGPITMTWYDGGRKPDPQLVNSRNLRPSGCLLVGTSGVLLSEDDYNERWSILPSGDNQTFSLSPELLPTRSVDQIQEFVDAVRGQNSCMSNFSATAGPMTETILTGVLALRKTGKLLWDSANLRVTNAPELDEFIRPTYRAGYTL